MVRIWKDSCEHSHNACIQGIKLWLGRLDQRNRRSFESYLQSRPVPLVTFSRDQTGCRIFTLKFSLDQGDWRNQRYHSNERRLCWFRPVQPRFDQTNNSIVMFLNVKKEDFDWNRTCQGSQKAPVITASMLCFVTSNIVEISVKRALWMVFYAPIRHVTFLEHDSQETLFPSKTYLLTIWKDLFTNTIWVFNVNHGKELKNFLVNVHIMWRRFLTRNMIPIENHHAKGLKRTRWSSTPRRVF